MPLPPPKSTLSVAEKLFDVCRLINTYGVGIDDLLRELLNSSRDRDQPYRRRLYGSLPRLYELALQQRDIEAEDGSFKALQDYPFDYVTSTAIRELQRLSKKESGLHINARKVEFEDISKLTIPHFQGIIDKYAPRTSSLLMSILSTSVRQDRRRARLEDFLDILDADSTAQFSPSPFPSSTIAPTSSILATPSNASAVGSADSGDVQSSSTPLESSFSASAVGKEASPSMSSTQTGNHDTQPLPVDEFDVPIDFELDEQLEELLDGYTQKRAIPNVSPVTRSRWKQSIVSALKNEALYSIVSVQSPIYHHIY